MSSFPHYYLIVFFSRGTSVPFRILEFFPRTHFACCCCCSHICIFTDVALLRKMRRHLRMLTVLLSIFKIWGEYKFHYASGSTESSRPVSLTLAERVLHLNIKAPLIHLRCWSWKGRSLESALKTPLLHIFLKTIALVGWLWTLTAQNTVVLHKITLWFRASGPAALRSWPLFLQI